MTRHVVRSTRAFVVLLSLRSAWPAAAWGPWGHALVTRAAVSAVDELPPWFRDAADALVELSNAPDRWRELDERIPALAARRPDHFFDLDVWRPDPLPPDRWQYVARAGARGIRPESVGFLPFAIEEEYGVLVSAFRDARDGRPGAREDALATAGILAHLAGDAAVPLHATRHHHGWIGPNPDDYTRSPDVHRWFETTLVTGVTVADVRVGGDAAHTLRAVPAAVESVIADSLAEVVHVYALERQSRIAHDDRPARALARERLGVGATFIARLWRTGWARSGNRP